MKKLLYLCFVLFCVPLCSNAQTEAVAPRLTQSSLQQAIHLFPVLRTPITQALDNQQPTAGQTATINQFFISFTNNPTLKEQVLKQGGNNQSLQALFVSIVGFSVLLLDEDLELMKTQLGLKTITSADIVKYMAGQADVSKTDIQELEESLKRYEQIRTWVGKENMVLLTNNKETLRQVLQ